MESTASARYLRYTVDMLQDADLPSIWKGRPVTQTIEALFQRKKLGGLGELDQLMQLDRRFNLLSGILVKMDRASMAYSVEARSPFLDHQLFDFTSKLPDAYKVNGTKRKYLLKALYADKLPAEVVKGKKISFEAPLGQWLQHDFKDVLHDVLGNRDAKLFNYLNYEAVQSILHRKIYQERNADYLLYSLLILALWLEENA
jgi:asparagine synthase (glutamine-hydrolysing)